MDESTCELVKTILHDRFPVGVNVANAPLKGEEFAFETSESWENSPNKRGIFRSQVGIHGEIWRSVRDLPAGNGEILEVEFRLIYRVCLKNCKQKAVERRFLGEL